ncbi:MAG: hypothetical protein EBV65_09970 [Gammaproteobacteria bacterium]|jgi:hypothetical protein|nr:hypothetical protein [Gammaproteobacteria bacterium]NCW57981.1 hypothetical protein [Gammaproteobacteria bacterium]NDA44060.1 hypothetical protein [Gammaproteobacteria bacterium]NDB17595.1 hypothetical protein [Gammaproteobacteria bacterium]
MKRFIFPMLMLVSLAACGTGLSRQGDIELKYVDYAGEPVEQITAMRGVDGWTPVSRNQLVIWTGINEAWLLRVWDNCTDLQFANSIRVTQTGRSISRFEKVIAGRDSCPIVDMRPIDVARMKADRKAARDTTPAPR